MATWNEMEAVQPLAATIMTNSIKRGRLSHAYLFQGSRGTGKQALALLLTQTLFCGFKAGIEPCQACVDCKRIASGNHPDVHWIVPDGQSIRKEQIDYLQKEFTYTALESDQKVYIIKDADTLTTNAANRILKFLEDPGLDTTALMLTENSRSVLATIRSRCQLIDFKPLDPVSFKQQLADEGFDQQSALLIAELTQNKEEAKALFEDVWFAEARKLMLQWVEISNKQLNDLYLFVHQRWLPHFKDRNEQARGLDLLLLAFRDILYGHLNRMDELVVFSPDDERLQAGVRTFSESKLQDVLEALLKAKQKLRQNVHQTLIMEQLALQIQR